MKHTIEGNDEYVRGKALAQCGDFHRIRESLKEHGLFEKCISLMKNQYQSFFTASEFEPGVIMWEAMTILGLYDIATLEHSLRTFGITKTIATSGLVGPREEKIILRAFIEESGVSLQNLLLAAIGHDVGKIKLPVEILHNSLTNEEMNALFIGTIRRGELAEEFAKRIGYNLETLATESDEKIVARIYEKGLRAVNLVPLSEAFSEKKYPGLLKLLEERGFTKEQTIKIATKIHEEEGKKIFESLCEPIIADLVGHHHNYQKEEESAMRFVMNIPFLKSHGHDAIFGVYNIIKIADSMDSLQSERPYKKGMSKIAALAELSHQSLTNRLEKSIYYLWVNTEYAGIKNLMKELGVDDSTFNDETSVKMIEKFLSTAESEFDRRMTDREN